MPLSPVALQTLVAASLATQPDELACGECAAHVDRFAEMSLAGLDAADALPLVEEHFQNCHCCREEFDALVDVLRQASRDGEPWSLRWADR